MTYLDYALYAADITLAVWYGYALHKYLIKDKTDRKTQLLAVLALILYVSVSVYGRSIV